MLHVVFSLARRIYGAAEQARYIHSQLIVIFTKPSAAACPVVTKCTAEKCHSLGCSGQDHYFAPTYMTLRFPDACLFPWCLPEGTSALASTSILTQGPSLPSVFLSCCPALTQPFSNPQVSPAFGFYFLQSELTMNDCARKRRWVQAAGGKMESDDIIQKRSA